MRLRLLSSLVVSALLLGTFAAPALAARELGVIVVFEDHVPDARRAAASAARQHRVQVEHIYEHALSGFSGAVPEGRLKALREDPRVASVEIDSVVHAAEKPTTSGSTVSSTQALPWGVERIGADLTTATGAGVHVYVLDTGIDADHPDLAANLGDGYAVETCTASHCHHPWDDDQGHGTHVAGTVGAIDDASGVVGVAPQVVLHSVKVLNSRGSGYRSGVIAGIDWVTSEATRLGVPVVVNMSLSGDGSKKGDCTVNGYVGTTSDSYHSAICNARNAGAVFAVAAGNAKIDASAKVPAAYHDAVITVSATTSSDSWASYSNWGNDRVDWTSNPSAPVAIGAPGSSVLSTTMGGGTGTKSGTSMAAPHVAGAAALLLGAGGYPATGSAFEQVRETLLASAEETTGNFTNATGYPHDEDFLHVDAAGAVGNPPTATAGSATTNEDTAVTVTLTGHDPDGCDQTSNPLTFAIASGPSNGTLGAVQQSATCLDADGDTATVVYTPAPDHNGPDSFVFTVTDADANTASATVSIDVVAVNDGPVANADAATATVSTTVAVDVLSNDGDVDGDALTVSAVDTVGTSGSVAIASGGTHVTYTAPASVGTGTDSFRYTVSDASGATTSATVTVTLQEAPTASTMSVSSISYSTWGGARNDKHLAVNVTVVDGSTPLGSATVEATTRLDRNGDGTVDVSYVWSTATSGEGVARFEIKNASAGTYTTVITSVTRTGYVWDGVTPSGNTYTKL